jgi:hypothetical protein
LLRGGLTVLALKVRRKARGEARVFEIKGQLDQEPVRKLAVDQRRGLENDIVTTRIRLGNVIAAVVLDDPVVRCLCDKFLEQFGAFIDMRRGSMSK